MNTISEAVNATDGVFSLPEAVHAANDAGVGPHEINFDLVAMGWSPPSRLFIRLTTPLESINRDLTIDGLDVVDVVRGPFNLIGPPGEPPPEAPKFRIFTINANVNAVFKDLGIWMGEVEGDGGDILNNGTLDLDHCVVGGGTASGSGGGVMNNGTLSLNVTTVQDSKAGNHGGGVMSPGGLTMLTSHITNNTAGGDGGGVYYGKGANCNINLCFFESNTAAGDGGGAYIAGPGGFTVDMSDSFVTQNKSTGAGKRGGGIYVNNATLLYWGGSISDNSANGSGGGLYAGTNALLQVRNVSVADNKTDENGGGMALEPSIQQQIDIVRCTFSGNQSTDLVNGQGGGVFMKGSSGSLLLSDCTFNTNSAAMGGGLYTERVTVIEGGRFVYNTASIAGGAIYGGKADMDINAYDDGSGPVFTELSDNQAPANMGAGIAWEQNGGGTLTYVVGGNNSDDIDYI